VTRQADADKNFPLPDCVTASVGILGKSNTEHKERKYPRSFWPSEKDPPRPQRGVGPRKSIEEADVLAFNGHIGA
jgi:hypothetical protein